MTTMQMNPQTSQATARFQAAQPGTVPFRTTMAHTWYLTGRKLHALVRQPWVLAFSVVQPVIWLFLFGQLFRRVIDIPGFAFHGTYLDYLVPGLIALIMTLIGALLTALVVAREWERGTMEAMMATPITMVEFIASASLRVSCSAANSGSPWKLVTASTPYRNRSENTGRSASC